MAKGNWPKAWLAFVWLALLAVSMVGGVTTAGYVGRVAIGSLIGMSWFVALPWLFALTGSWRALGWLGAVLLPLAAVEIYLAVGFGASINAHTLTIMLGTDRHEMLGVAMHAWPLLILCATGIAITLLAAHRLHRESGMPCRERLQFAPHALAGLIALGGVLWIVVPEEITPNNGDVVGLHWRLAERVFPFGLPLRLISFGLERRRQQAQLAVSAEHTWHARGTEADRIVVLVISESQRAANFELGGYARETNPRLMQRAGVVWMQDYVANAVVTAESVPLMLTRREVGQANAAFAERSVVSAFNEAGYGTYWISNQQTAGVHDLLIASYAQEAQHKYFGNLATFDARGAYDGELLPQIDAALAGSGKRFLVVHLMGSHFTYTDRYPASEAYFPVTGTPAAQWRNAYDNSIRYTDAVLDQIIERLARDSRPSVLVFASDHGELLIEPNCDKRWHGHGAMDDVRAAALVWLSPHPQHVAQRIQLQRASAMRTSGKDLVATLLDAGEVSVPAPMPNQSWLDDYVSRSRRVSTLSGVADADLPAVGACRLLQRVPGA